jgi:hypothetical protein
MVPSYTLFLPLFWVELGLNSLIAPLLFLLLKKVIFLTNTWS